MQIAWIIGGLVVGYVVMKLALYLIERFDEKK